jgi:hypothetical protein
VGGALQGEEGGGEGGLIKDLQEDALHLKSGGKPKEFAGSGREIVPLKAGLAAPFFAN